MLRGPLRRLSAWSSLLVLLASWLAVDAVPALRLRADDRNRDGRPDVWRRYDAAGALEYARFDVDHDGRADREEYDRHGRLVRREIDRDADARADLVEVFDRSGALIRRLVDVDRDGRADVVAVVSEGRTIRTLRRSSARHTPAPAPGRATSESALLSLDDPFVADPTWQAPIDAPATHAAAVVIVLPAAAVAGRFVWSDVPAVVPSITPRPSFVSWRHVERVALRGPPPVLI